jgi:outer membrane protein OmpA-like peptidoglycan-associated protein
MKSKIYVIIILCFWTISQANSQKVKYSYDFSSVRLLENPNINSYAEEINSLYSRDYDTIFFVRSHHNENIGRDKINQDIWYCHLANGIWSDPINFKELNNAENNSIIGMGSASETLYILNSYTSTTIRNKGIAYSNYSKGSWSKPQTIDLEINVGNQLYAFFINHSEDVILITMYNGLSEGDEDLFVSLKGENGEWRDPVYMGHEVNSSGYETSPYLADDKKTIFFTSNGFGGFGDGDIFMSHRLDDSWSTWSEPVNLGKDVNSDKFDGYFSIYENGEFMFSSNRDSKFSDIFVGKWERTEIKEAPVVVKEEIKVVVEKPKEVLPGNADVYFDSNSSYFDQTKYKEVLSSIASSLKINPTYSLIIQGHTDAVGDENYNLFLSLKRGRSVADYILSKEPSIDKKRIMVVPNGESEAKEDANANRRVSIKYILMN